MKILYDPAPRTTSEVFSAADRARFFNEYEVVVVDEQTREGDYQQHLASSEVVISQQPMDRDRLERAVRLRAIFNVETNFLPNIDYTRCFERGIHVLTPASVFAEPVAEIGLGMALSLARDIHTAHLDFTRSTEAWGLASNSRAELLSRNHIGLVGYGDLGRALHRLLLPFNARLRVYDPWLPDDYLRRQGIEPVPLSELLHHSRVVFVVAAVTTENEHLFDKETLAAMPDGAMLILLSRAALADFEALAQEARSGRLRIATDVFPEEPLPAEASLRSQPNFLFSAHRAGALTSALNQIGALVLEDLQQLKAGLPPISCRRAERETIEKLRSKPIEKS